ncbi:histidine phosphatase family protein [Cognatishimia sp.]|uniref:histidine phosphatase family protein n=1 Tax=Cognatishimia sp. TaxID=2211648 RepID=UPI0035182E0C
MRRLSLVRHGPTHAKTMVGWSDLPADLSDTAAIARLSAHLPQDALVISSDLSRAAATADAIQGSRARLPHDPGLREMNFGDWELQRFDEVEDQETYRAFWETPGDVSPPNGESWHTLEARVGKAVDTALAAYPDKDLIVVAHFGAILTQLQRSEKLTAYEAFGHRIDNLSVTEIDIDASGWTTKAINHTP